MCRQDAPIPVDPAVHSVVPGSRYQSHCHVVRNGTSGGVSTHQTMPIVGVIAVVQDVAEAPVPKVAGKLEGGTRLKVTADVEVRPAEPVGITALQGGSG